MAQFASNILFSIDTALQQKGGVNEEVITTSKTLTYQDSTIQIIKNNTAGVLNVTLPEFKEGTIFFVRCKASSGANLSLQNPASSPGGVQVLAPGEACLVACEGTVWQTVIKA
mgnify:CR=1 FL=1|tara:strand:+ start:365 stop:703 length:339 start_codon:yes stop_codon:yes gene_type:complete